MTDSDNSSFDAGYRAGLQELRDALRAVYASETHVERVNIEAAINRLTTQHSGPATSSKKLAL